MTPRRLEVSVYNTAADGASQCSNENEGTINPTEVAHKVLAETWMQRQALEKMQRESTLELKQRQYSREIKALEILERNKEDSSSLEAVSPLAGTDCEDIQISSGSLERTENKNREPRVQKPVVPIKPAELSSSKALDGLLPAHPPKIPDYNQTVQSSFATIQKSDDFLADQSKYCRSGTSLKMRDDGILTGNALQSLSLSDRKYHERRGNWYESDESESPLKSSYPSPHHHNNWSSSASEIK